MCIVYMCVCEHYMVVNTDCRAQPSNVLEWTNNILIDKPFKRQ